MNTSEPNGLNRINESTITLNKLNIVVMRVLRQEPGVNFIDPILPLNRLIISFDLDRVSISMVKRTSILDCDPTTDQDTDSEYHKQHSITLRENSLIRYNYDVIRG